MIKLNLNIPPELQVIFSEDAMLNVCTHDKRARKALLWWLWSKRGVWISQHSSANKQAWKELTEGYPNIDNDRIEFKNPNELLLKEYDYGVVEDPVAIPNCVAWARDNVHKQLRLYEPTRSTESNYVDDLNLSLIERKQLLSDVRARRNREFDEYNLISSITKESLYEFLLEFWPDVIPEQFHDNWHIKYLCDELQFVAERVFANQPKLYDLIINIAPGSTKSLICSVMFPAWCWARMPSLRYIGSSYAYTLAADLARKNRQLVKCPKYQLAFGIKMLADQDAKAYFMNEQGGMRLGIGTGGIAGFHAHIIGVDDQLDPNKALSEPELKAANDHINNSLNQRKIDQRITPIVLIMQRLHQNDPTGSLLNRTGGEGIKHICIPAEETDDINPPELRQFYKKGLMDPTRLPQDVLEEKKLLGQFLYAGQYLQTPTMPSGGMFKWQQITIQKKPKEVNFVKIVRYWDKAGTEDDGAYTAGVKLALDNSKNIWILHVYRGQWDSAKREKEIQEIGKSDGPVVTVGVEQEPGSSGKESANNTKKNLNAIGVKHVILDRPSGDKVLRADPFSTRVNAGHVNMIPGEWVQPFLDEVALFPLSTFKDQVDAASGAYKLLTDKKFRIGGGFNK